MLFAKRNLFNRLHLCLERKDTDTLFCDHCTNSFPENGISGNDIISLCLAVIGTLVYQKCYLNNILTGILKERKISSLSWNLPLQSICSTVFNLIYYGEQGRGWEQPTSSPQPHNFFKEIGDSAEWWLSQWQIFPVTSCV